MESKQDGWVVVNYNHPRTGLDKPMMVKSTFSSTRKEAIRKFIEGSGNSWVFWSKKWNYQCVKASQTIVTE